MTIRTAGRGAGESGQGTPVQDWTGSGAQALSDAGQAVAGRLGKAGERIEARLEQAGSALAAEAGQAAQATGGYLARHPWQALGLAAAAGFVAGVLVSRR